MSDIRVKILWWVVRYRLKKDRPFIIAITGSIAKTSTKDAVGAVLRAAFPKAVRVGYGNLNSLLGLPLAILGFELDFRKTHITWQWPFLLLGAVFCGLVYSLPKYLVIELGADRPGDIEKLASQLRPDVAIITIVGEAHLQYYNSMAALVAEKQSVLKWVGKDGAIFVNAHDPFLESHRKASDAKLFVVDADLPHLAESFAEAVAKYLNIDPTSVQKALSGNWRPPHRMNQFKVGDWTILDDSYNASPAAMRSALTLLGNLPQPRVAILGSMLELGSTEAKLHQEVGEFAATKADLIISVGELAKNYKPKHFYGDSTLAAADIFHHLPNGGSILVKGSYGIKMNKIIEAITKHK